MTPSKNSGIPIGGLGTGSFELREDGKFYQWQIMNNMPWGGGSSFDAPEDTLYFGLQVEAEGLRRQALLCLPGEQQSNLNDTYGLPWVEYPVEIRYEAKFPFSRLTYIFDNFPIRVSLEAFSPFIPHDSKNSGLPAAFFNFTVENATDKPVRVWLFAAFRNLTGYSDKNVRSHIKFVEKSDYSSLEFSRLDRASENGANGTISLMVPLKEGVTRGTHIRTQRDIWEPLIEEGRLENRDYSDFSGEIGNMGDSYTANLLLGTPFGVLCQDVTIDGGRSKGLEFVFAWHFPFMTERIYRDKNKQGECIGHKYSYWFKDSSEVAKYLLENEGTLTERTRRFTEAFYSSDMPQWLADAVFDQLTTLVKSSWWDKQGRFGIWEGLGCCGLQTTDITYYSSFAIVQMFPELQKSQMYLTRSNIEQPGKIPHMMPGNFSCCDLDHRGRIDLIPQFVLLVWRDWRWTGDEKYLKDMWKDIKNAFTVFESFDTDGDGLPNNSGPDQTYDQLPIKGTSAFVGYLYVAALKAGIEIAEHMNEPEYAGLLTTKLNHAEKELEKQLWNGDYYILSNDLQSSTKNNGIMADQVSGDWFYRQTTSKGILPDANVTSALAQVYKYCSKPGGFLSNCAWSNRSEAIKIGRHTANQSDWPWTGVEYEVAAHMLLMGLKEEGLHVVENVWKRHARTGLRFNHIECGQHYYRALSSWSIYLSLCGFCYDGVCKTMQFSTENLSQFIYVLPEGWGRISLDGTRVTIECLEGKLEIEKVIINGKTYPVVNKSSLLSFDL